MKEESLTIIVLHNGESDSQDLSEVGEGGEEI